jgi:hypothetical protein
MGLTNHNVLLRLIAMHMRGNSALDSSECGPGLKSVFAVPAMCWIRRNLFRMTKV